MAQRHEVVRAQGSRGLGSAAVVLRSSQQVSLDEQLICFHGQRLYAGEDVRSHRSAARVQRRRQQRRCNEAGDSATTRGPLARNIAASARTCAAHTAAPRRAHRARGGDHVATASRAAARRSEAYAMHKRRPPGHRQSSARSSGACAQPLAQKQRAAGRARAAGEERRATVLPCQRIAALVLVKHARRGTRTRLLRAHPPAPAQRSCLYWSLPIRLFVVKEAQRQIAVLPEGAVRQPRREQHAARVAAVGAGERVAARAVVLDEHRPELRRE